MSAHQKIHQANLSNGATLFKDQGESGLTIKEWCSQNNTSIDKFYYWRRQAKESYVDSILRHSSWMSTMFMSTHPNPMTASQSKHNVLKMSSGTVLQQLLSQLPQQLAYIRITYRSRGNQRTSRITISSSTPTRQPTVLFVYSTIQIRTFNPEISLYVNI